MFGQWESLRAWLASPSDRTVVVLESSLIWYGMVYQAHVFHFLSRSEKLRFLLVEKVLEEQNLSTRGAHGY